MATPTTKNIQPSYQRTEADDDRSKMIADGWKAYHGQFDAPLARMPGQPDDNVLSNRCVAVVDKGVSFLFGKPVSINVDQDAPQDARDFVEDVWGDEDVRMTMLAKLAMSGAIAGQAFLRIVPRANQDPAWRIVSLDPAIVCVQTDPQDVDKVLLYCVEYQLPTTVNGKPAFMTLREEVQRQDDDTWLIGHWSRIGDRAPWSPAGDPIAWPYDFPPIFSCQNLPYPHEYWGRADLTPDIIHVNDALNLVQSNVNRVLKLYGQPVIFASGTGQSVIDIKPGKIIGLPTTDAHIGSVPITSDLANALSFAANLRSDMDEQSRVPGVALGRIADLPRGAISGVALQLLFQPLIEKTVMKQRLYGKLIIDITQALLKLANYGDLDVDISWQNLLPVDDLAAAQTSLILKQLGVSDATIMMQLGYDPDDEMEKSQTEDAKKLVNFGRGQAMPPTPQTAPQMQPPAAGEDNAE